MGRLKYLVIHCTATPEGREVSGAEIRAWHTNPVSRAAAAGNRSDILTCSI